MAQTLQFLDFELLIGAARQPGVYPVSVINAPAGQASGSLALDPNASDFKSALDSIANRATTDESLHQFGRRLFDALLADPIGDLYYKSLGMAQGAGKRLRLRLRVEPPEISALPWEYLYDPEADLPLAISPDFCLSRYLPINEPTRWSEVELPLRVLVVVSAPSDLGEYGMPTLNADEEIKRIQKALEKREGAGQVKTYVLPHAVAADLRETLRTFRPNIVHFIGHGAFQQDQGMLVMEDDERRTRLVSDRQFREFFLGAEDARLVILNACQGATQSSARALSGLAPQVVRRGLSAVVAMQSPIPDKVALSFAREFYRALAQYEPVDAAVAEGRRAVYQDFGSDQPDWGAPVIFMRSPDGVLFSPPQTKPAEVPVAQPAAKVNIGGTGANFQDARINIGNIAGGNVVTSVGQEAAQFAAQPASTPSTATSVSKENIIPTGGLFHYDVFISYSHRDEAWAQGWLLPHLEAAGLHACIDFRDFEPGAPSLTEMERAVSQSRKTLLVLTPDYLASQWAEFENLLVQTLDPAARQRRLLPLLLKPCELPLRIRTLTYVDFTRSDRASFQLERLIAAIRSEGGTASPRMPDAVPIAVLPPTAAPSPIPPEPSLARLRELLTSRFDLEELRTLCFDIGVDWDSLPGEGKAGKARELVAYMQRRSSLSDLVAAILRARPDISM